MVDLFSLQLEVQGYMLNVLCEKGTPLLQDVGRLLLEDPRVVARSFDKSQKLMIL